ncbi:MAG: hypothetical protein GYA55_04295 [SAR324 cluster bacterium]|uniref:Uncharacterized protein n=1 Tax=SAR324 cluster bacterium TaxID=2024889 RepID=A0A7X9IJQ8_9DELT|nr:hypothetical protein [SAR324 cluster bacterium]
MSFNISYRSSLDLESVKTPDNIVSILEACSGGEGRIPPKRLRIEDAKVIVDAIVKNNSLGIEHLEKIISHAQKSSEYCWEVEEEVGLNAIEYRRLARLYDSIVATAERKLASMSMCSSRELKPEESQVGS